MDDYTWTSNATSLCYETSKGESFCGKQGECIGMVLPLVFEEDWNYGFRIFIYLFGLLYRLLYNVCLEKGPNQLFVYREIGR